MSVTERQLSHNLPPASAIHPFRRSLYLWTELDCGHFYRNRQSWPVCLKYVNQIQRRLDEVTSDRPLERWHYPNVPNLAVSNWTQQYYGEENYRRLLRAVNYWSSLRLGSDGAVTGSGAAEESTDMKGVRNSVFVVHPQSVSSLNKVLVDKGDGGDGNADECVGEQVLVLGRGPTSADRDCGIDGMMHGKSGVEGNGVEEGTTEMDHISTNIRVENVDSASLLSSLSALFAKIMRMISNSISNHVFQFGKRYKKYLSGIVVNSSDTTKVTYSGGDGTSLPSKCPNYPHLAIPCRTCRILYDNSAVELPRQIMVCSLLTMLVLSFVATLVKLSRWYSCLNSF